MARRTRDRLDKSGVGYRFSRRFFGPALVERLQVHGRAMVEVGRLW